MSQLSFDTAPAQDHDRRKVRDPAVVSDLDKLDATLRDIKGAVSRDYETDGVDPVRGNAPFSVQFYAEEESGKPVLEAYLDFRFFPDQREALVALLRRTYARTDIQWVTHGGSFEYKMDLTSGHASRFLGGAGWGAPPAGFQHDTMLGAFAIMEERPGDPELIAASDGKRKGSFKLKTLVQHELGKKPSTQKAIWDYMQTHGIADPPRFDLVPWPMMAEYGLDDVRYQYALHRKYAPVLESEFKELYETDCEVALCVAEMELRGHAIDVPRTEALITRLAAEQRELEGRLFASAGRAFDVGSHDELYAVLYGDLKLPFPANPNKQYSTDELVLKNLKHPVPAMVLEWREYNVLLNTYAIPWARHHALDGVLYGRFNMIGARTRRFSADDPNLQNIPTRSALAQLLRECLVCRDGYVIDYFDYSQLQFRIFVHYAAPYPGGQELVRAYVEDPHTDFHQLVADLVHVDRNKQAKGLNFGMLFGMGKEKLKATLGVSDAEAEKILAWYYDKFPVKHLRRDVERVIRERGWVKDVFGGRRHLKPELAYKGVNALDQMCEADLVRKAIARVGRYLRQEARGAHLLMTIHDELAIEWPLEMGQERIVTHRRAVRALMEDFPMFKVPIKVDVATTSTTWAAKRKLKEGEI